MNVSASTSVHLLNSMEAEVMWNFTNVDIGKYHLVAINPDNSEVSLSDAITIEKSTGYLLESFVSAPDLIRLGKTAYYNFTIVNNGNVDIPFVETAIATEKYARIVKMHTFGNVLSRKNYGVNKEHVEMKDFFEQDGYNVILLTSRNVKAGEKFEVSVMYENFLYNVFPVTLMAEGFNREDFMSRQLAGIEIIRNVAIYNPEFFNDPEFSLMAKDKNVFTELILNQYIDFGIIAPSDTIGLAECTTCGIPSGDDPTVVFSPGTSPGVLVLPFAEFGKNQRYKWEINNYEGFAGIWNGWDMVYTYGPIDINATPQQPFTVEVISLDFFNRPGYLGAFAPAFDKCWPIAIAKGGIKGFDANKFVIDTSAFVKYNYTYGGVFSIKLHGTDSLMLCFTARKPGIGESGIPGGPGGYGQDGAPGGDGGDGDENTPPGQGGIGGQGGYGDGNRSTGKGGKGGKGGKHHDNSKPDAPEGPDGPEGPEGPENPDSPTPPPPPPKPDGTPDGTPPQVPPPGVPPADVPPSKPPKGLPDGKPGYPHYPDLPGFPDPDRPNNPGRPDGPPGTPPAPGCSVAPTSTMSSVLCKAAPFASGIQCGISMFGCYKLFVSGGAALGLVFTPIGSVIGASAAAIIAAGTCGWSYGNCIQGKAFAGDKLKEYFCRPVVGSCDPNEIQGPVGYGPEKFVSNEEELPYRILYENDPDFATAPAQRVVITQKLDSNLDASTLRLGNFGFSNYIFDVPQGLSNYTTRLKLADSLGFDVNITAGLDVVKREIFWIFQSIDPATGLSPEDPLAGYLPVNDSTGKGEGFVTYTIKPRMNTNTGDSITAQAAIVFDINVPIITNTAWNIIDARKPVSVITNQTSVEHNSVITLNVQAADDTGGSGIRDYVLYYSENDGPFVKYDSVFTDYTISIIGNPGSNYCFFTLATDNVGHTELMKDQCELSLMLQPASPLGVNWLYFTGELNGKDAHLKWATAAESNSENFVIERSTDAIKFESIGASKAQGNTQTTTKYMYVDKNAAYVSAAVLYYRLKQVDKDGKFTYSNVVALPITKGRFAPIISVYPNPFEKVTTLMVTTSEPASPGDKVQLFSVSGVLLYERDVSGRSNNAQIVLSDLPKLATGIYFLKTYINGQVKTMKVTHL
ncbi:MAG: T9SS type A sorting domain-containing protein [Ginsengibacter sp.]